MRTIAVNCLKYVGVFILLILIFNLLLYVSCLFDSRLLKENVRESADILLDQTMDKVILSLLWIKNDNAADAVCINEAYAIDCRHPFESYMKARKNYNPRITRFEARDYIGEGMSAIYVDEFEHNRFGYVDFEPLRELSDFVSDKLEIAIVYGRYWHGNIVLYRPLLLFCNVTQIRMLMLGVYICLYAYFIYLVNKRFGLSIALIFALSLVCCGYFTVFYCLSNSPTFLTMIVSGIILIKRIDVIKDFSMFVFVVACVVNFFEFLTVPLVTLGMVCSLSLLKLMEEGKDWAYCLRFVVVNSLIWLLGFAGTWICKWVLYDLTINDGTSMVQVGLQQCMFRLQRTCHTIIPDRFIEPFTENGVFIAVMLMGRASLFAMLSSVPIMWTKGFKVSSQGLNKRALSFLLLSTYPLIWYLALANHTILHAFFAYRHAFVTMLGVLLAMHEQFWPLDKKS